MAVSDATGYVEESMSSAQVEHMDDLRTEAWFRIGQKYRAGQAEHGGNLFDLSAMALIDNAIDEAIDQLTYLLTLKSKLQ